MSCSAPIFYYISTILQPFTDWLTVFILTLIVFTVLALAFHTVWLFQHFKTFTMFSRRFLIRYGQLNFLLLLPCSHGLLVRFFIYLLSCQYRNPCKKLYSSLYFVALYFTRLLLSGFSLCITRIKNLFFWKEIDKTFCCFCVTFHSLGVSHVT